MSVWWSGLTEVGRCAHCERHHSLRRRLWTVENRRNWGALTHCSPPSAVGVMWPAASGSCYYGCPPNSGLQTGIVSQISLFSSVLCLSWYFIMATGRRLNKEKRSTLFSPPFLRLRFLLIYFWCGACGKTVRHHMAIWQRKCLDLMTAAKQREGNKGGESQ